jgi:hypothetical protein
MLTESNVCLDSETLTAQQSTSNALRYPKNTYLSGGKKKSTQHRKHHSTTQSGLTNASHPPIGSRTHLTTLANSSSLIGSNPFQASDTQYKYHARFGHTPFTSPMKMEPTEVSETSTLSIHTPGNYPKEEITRYSKHGESLKTRSTPICLEGSQFRHLLLMLTVA